APNAGHPSEFDIGPKLNHPSPLVRRVRVVVWRNSSDGKGTPGLNVPAEPVGVAEIRTAVRYAWLKVGMVEGIQHLGLEGEMEALTNRNHLRDGDIVVDVMRAVEVDQLADSTWCRVWVDVLRVRASAGCKVFRWQEGHLSRTRDVIDTDGAL